MALPHRPYARSLKARSRALRHEPTAAERKLWYELLARLPDKFTRQKPLGRYIADFYCSRHRLVVEIDGDSHYADRAERHDAIRTAELNYAGIRVIRFTNADVAERFDGVCAEIMRALET